MSTDVANNDDPHYARQLALLTLVWLILVLGAGVVMIYMLPG